MKDKLTNRTAVKRDKIHQDILTVAAELISHRGSTAVTLEEIARHADVARKTLYNHFDNKEALIKELVIPVCKHASDYLKQFSDKPLLTLDDIWTYCLELWEDESLNLLLLYQVSVEDCADMDSYTHGFIFVFTRLLESIPEYKTFSDAELRFLSNVIYQTYMPLLQSIGHHEQYQEMFRNSMTGLLQGVLSQMKEH